MIVVIGGVHAVGKTYLAAPAAARMGFRHITASELIKRERGVQSWSADKKVSDAEEDQRALVRALQAPCFKREKILLDGHFALRGSLGQNVRIDPGVFKDIGPSGIIVVNAPIEVISQRLRARGDESWNNEQIAELVRDESEHARHVANKLGVALLELNSPDQSAFMSAVKQICK